MNDTADIHVRTENYGPLNYGTELWSTAERMNIILGGIWKRAALTSSHDGAVASLLLVLVLLPRRLALLLRQVLVRLVLQQRVVLVVAHDPLLLLAQQIGQQPVLGTHTHNNDVNQLTVLDS